jgi:hypothetical protein
MLTRKVNVVTTVVLSVVMLGGVVQAKPQKQPPARNAADSAPLTKVKEAVEARFKELETTSTVKVREVKLTQQPKGGAVVSVSLAPPSEQRFDFHAQSAYMLLWQAFRKAPAEGVKQLERVRVSLAHGAARMDIDCPIASVESSYGYTDFATLKRQCDVR